MGTTGSKPEVYLRSDALTLLITRRNLSISEVARRCGYTRTYFTRFLQGDRHVSERLRVRLMDCLGLIPGDEEDFDRLFQILE